MGWLSFLGPSLCDAVELIESAPFIEDEYRNYALEELRSGQIKPLAAINALSTIRKLKTEFVNTSAGYETPKETDRKNLIKDVLAMNGIRLT